MKVFTQKKGIILHPWTLIFVAFVLGMVFMYLMMSGVLKVPFLSC